MSETGRYWSIRRLGEAYRRGETTPTKVTADLLKRITSDNDRLRAYAHVAPDGAMAQAEIAERELVAGFDRGPLHGVPIGLKVARQRTSPPAPACPGLIRSGPARTPPSPRVCGGPARSSRANWR